MGIQSCSSAQGISESTVIMATAAENFKLIDADGGGTLDFEELQVFVAFVTGKAPGDVTEADSKGVLGDDTSKEFDEIEFRSLCAAKGIDAAGLNEFLKSQ